MNSPLHTNQLAPAWSSVLCDASKGQCPGLTGLRQLIRGEVSVIVIRNLLSQAVWDQYRSRIQAQFAKAVTTNYANGALTTIGPYLARYLPDLKTYLAEAARINQLYRDLGFDLCARMRDHLQRALAMESLVPASEPGLGRYAEGVVRIHADGVRNPLHNDNIMRDGAGQGISVTAIRHQLSCVVCLQECDGGGELHHYAKSWEESDEVFKIPGGLGYDEKVVAGRPVEIFKPRTGDVYLINPTHYHSIETVRGADRITLGFFLGFPDDQLDHAWTWS